jgi:tetratricopeptide (TPR) repeat protein
MTHYDDESLFQYLEGTSPIASEIDSHVSECAECAGEVDGQRELIASLSDRDTWQSAPAPALRQIVANITAFADHARQEEERAAALCDQILTGPAQWWRQRLFNTEGAATAGMVKQLLDKMRVLLERSPANALQATSLAIEVANGLDITTYPSDYVVKLRAQAHRDHAYVLSFMGRFPEALDCADRAKRLFDQTPLPEYDLARLALVKATILQFVERSSEAAALAQQAGDTFLRFGDRARYLTARITEANVLYNSGAIERALEIWKSVEHDPALEGVNAIRVTQNIALGLTDTGRPAEAIDYIQRCVAEYALLGMETERTRSRAMLAHALMALGKHHEAIPALRQAWREFEQLELIGDAGLMALILAEALMATDQPEDVPAICRDVIAQFTRSGMASRAITALSFLREAVAIGQASPSLVRHVHAFLRELPAEQPRLFAPPPGGVGE